MANNPARNNNLASYKVLDVVDSETGGLTVRDIATQIGASYSAVLDRLSGVLKPFVTRVSDGDFVKFESNDAGKSERTRLQTEIETRRTLLGTLRYPTEVEPLPNASALFDAGSLKRMVDFTLVLRNAGELTSSGLASACGLQVTNARKHVFASLLRDELIAPSEDDADVYVATEKGWAAARGLEIELSATLSGHLTGIRKILQPPTLALKSIDEIKAGLIEIAPLPYKEGEYLKTLLAGAAQSASRMSTSLLVVQFVPRHGARSIELQPILRHGVRSDLPNMTIEFRGQPISELTTPEYIFAKRRIDGARGDASLSMELFGVEGMNAEVAAVVDEINRVFDEVGLTSEVPSPSVTPFAGRRPRSSELRSVGTTVSARVVDPVARLDEGLDKVEGMGL